MNEPLNEGNFNRLAKALMEKHGVNYSEALNRLGALKLRVLLDPEDIQTEAAQAALLTIVQCGCRSFLGGVHLDLQGELPLRLPWPEAHSLNQVVRDLGGTDLKDAHDAEAIVIVGRCPCHQPDALRVLCDGWRGGVQPADLKCTSFMPGEDFAAGGVLGGALAIEHAFLDACGLSGHPLDGPEGLSLWRPDADWLDPAGGGPPLELLPRRLWLIGLGHLGQAYAWSLGLLPYRSPDQVSLLLQDFDRVVSGNWTAGLLCRHDDVGKHKTRVVARWLEDRGFETVICERPFDERTHRTGEEPFVALCGVDVLPARKLLENAGFDLVVECGVGRTHGDFDRLKVHTFPNASKRPTDIWQDGAIDQLRPPSRLIAEAVRDQEDCGILAMTIENKSVSASFVGAAAGAIVVGELLRALHGGVRCELFHGHLRSLRNAKMMPHPSRYRTEMAKTGFVGATRYQTMPATLESRRMHELIRTEREPLQRVAVRASVENGACGA